MTRRPKAAQRSWRFRYVGSLCSIKLATELALKTITTPTPRRTMVIKIIARSGVPSSLPWLLLSSVEHQYFSPR